MTNAIELRDLRKTYPRNWASPPFEALKGISLTVEEGEVFGFIGPNGAGKSTFIKTTLGLLLPVSGSVLLNGLPPRDTASRAKLARAERERQRKSTLHRIAREVETRRLELVALHREMQQSPAGSQHRGIGSHRGVATGDVL